VIPFIAAVLFIQSADNPRLAQIDQEITALIRDGKAQDTLKTAPARRAEILKMVESDQLTTGTDFLRASNLYDDPMGWFETRESQFEFALCALVLGSDKAPEALKRTWDFLMVSMGERQRFGFIKASPEFDPAGKFTPDSTYASISRIFNNLEGARKLAESAKDNEEIQKLRDADQSVREGKIDWDKLRKAHDQDIAHQMRVKEMLQQGIPRTANDYEAMSLIMQHSDEFTGYRLACELMLASILLGQKDTSLAVMTYDRMLLSKGHRQRFGTQGWSSGIAPMESTGINDRMRALFHQPKLADLKAREQEMLKKYFGDGG
jgi:hypothetical protein